MCWFISFCRGYFVAISAQICKRKWAAVGWLAEYVLLFFLVIYGIGSYLVVIKHDGE